MDREKLRAERRERKKLKKQHRRMQKVRILWRKLCGVRYLENNPRVLESKNFLHAVLFCMLCLCNSQEEDDGGSSKKGVVYVGHIPHGFFEQEMRGFFSQFGTVTRLRLARSRKV